MEREGLRKGMEWSLRELWDLAWYDEVVCLVYRRVFFTPGVCVRVLLHSPNITSVLSSSTSPIFFLHSVHRDSFLSPQVVTDRGRST